MMIDKQQLAALAEEIHQLDAMERPSVAALHNRAAYNAQKADMVNHPPHYQGDGVECIDAIRAALGRDGFIAYCRGNAIKYAWRIKSNPAEDMEKARWYLARAAKELEE